MTRQELNEMVAAGTIKEHHTSYVREYVRRTGNLPAPKAYNGKFGKGFVTTQPNWDSSRYSYITYYIFS